MRKLFAYEIFVILVMACIVYIFPGWRSMLVQVAVFLIYFGLSYESTANTTQLNLFGYPIYCRIGNIKYCLGVTWMV